MDRSQCVLQTMREVVEMTPQRARPLERVQPRSPSRPSNPLDIIQLAAELRDHIETSDPDLAATELAGKTGWVTLVKDGKKLVTSRLRLDCTTRIQQVDQWNRRARNQQVEQWNRRAANTKGAKKLSVAPVGVAIRDSEKRALAGEAPSLPIALELAADPASFAFGGLFPGTLHSHGKLHPVHRVSYSIGTAGKYLLHVR